MCHCWKKTKIKNILSSGRRILLQHYEYRVSILHILFPFRWGCGNGTWLVLIEPKNGFETEKVKNEYWNPGYLPPPPTSLQTPHLHCSIEMKVRETLFFNVCALNANVCALVLRSGLLGDMFGCCVLQCVLQYVLQCVVLRSGLLGDMFGCSTPSKKRCIRTQESLTSYQTVQSQRQATRSAVSFQTK